MHIVPGVLPFLAIAFSFLLIWKSSRAAQLLDQAPFRLAEAIMMAAAFVGLFTSLSAEVLGAFGRLDRTSVTLLWTVTTALLGAIAYRVTGRAHPVPVSAPAPLNWQEKLILSGAGLLLAMTLLQALLSPPNTGDALAYHLPRQVRWVQQASLAHFYTTNPRQVMMPIFTEICGTHLLLLTGGDRLHNLVAVGALLLGGVAAYSIALRLHASRTGALLGAFLVFAIPTAILQSSIGKNDVVLTAWVCIFAYWVLRVSQSKHLRWVDVLMLGASLGLALYTKGTAAVFLAPWCIWLVVALFRQLRQHILGFAAIALMVGLINGPHLLRNHQTFGSPSGPSLTAGGYDLTNLRMGAPAVFTNALRNGAAFCALPWEPWNRAVFTAVAWAHESVGMPLNDPRYSYYGGSLEKIVYQPSDEATAVCPVHFWLFLAALVVLCLKKSPQRTLRLGVAGALISGYLIFCAVFKWQLWHPRLLLPLVALACPVIAAQLSEWRSRWGLVALLVAALGFAQAAFASPLHPFMGENSVFKRDRFTLLCLNDADVAHVVSDCCNAAAVERPRTVGFFSKFSDMPEYLFTSGITSRMKDSPPTFLHLKADVLMNGPTAPTDLPDLLIAERRTLDRENARGRIRHWPFQVVETYGEYALFKAVR